LQTPITIFGFGCFPKKHHLGPQNVCASSGPEKLLKTINCAIIKDNERDNGGVTSGIGGWPPIST